jgi:hypothetical protein
MHNFGAVHMYHFSAGSFGREQKLRPCLVLNKHAAKLGLVPACEICPRSTQMHLADEALRGGVAFVVPASVATIDGDGFRFTKAGVFILNHTQRVPHPSLHAGTYCGELPPPYLQEAKDCDRRRRWWWKQKRKNNRPE